MTKTQLQMIFNIIDEMNLQTEVAKEIMKMSFNVDRSKDLTKSQASDFIQDLLALKEVRS